MEFSVADIINIILGVFSFALAVLAICLSIFFFKQSKDAESHASELLVRTQDQVELMRTTTMEMLTKFIDYSTHAKPADEVVLKAFEMLQQSIGASQTPALNDGASAPEGEKPKDDSKELTRTYIAAMYWGAIANVAMNALLPADHNQVNDGTKTLLANSKADFLAAKAWLAANPEHIKDSGDGAANYYRELGEVAGFESDIKTFEEMDAAS